LSPLRVGESIGAGLAAIKSQYRDDSLLVLADCVAKVVLHWGSKILRPVGAAFV
jgi:hypothetical protein